MKAWYDWYGLPELSHQFQVEREGPRPTGILDANGEMIYHHPNPVGFVTEFSKPRVRVKAGRQEI